MTPILSRAQGALATLSLALASCSMPGPTSSAEVRRSLERLDAYANVAAPGEPGDERRVSALRHPVGDEGRRADLRLLYLHGTPGDAEGWADFLVDPVGDLPSSAVDRPGFGKSDTRSLATLEGQSRALAPFMGEPGVRTIVVGHSYGGPVALQAALDYPDEIAAAVILAGSVSPALEKRRWFNYAAKGLSWVLPRALRRSNQEVWPLRADLERLAKSLGEIRVPVVIVHGTDDGLVPYGNATFMEEALSGAASISLRTLDGAGHMFIWEERWVPTVREAILEAALKVQAAG